MKKLLIALLVASGLSLTAKADSQAFTIATATCSNLLSAPVKVTQIIYTAPANNNTSFKLIDSPTTTLTNIIGAYSTVTQYATNYVATYTNFFGVTNAWTNLALVSLTNTVTAQTNNFPVRADLAASTNNTIILNNVSYFFQQGLTITNTGAGNATLSITYQKM